MSATKSVGGLTTAASAAIAKVVGYTTISTTLSELAANYSSAAGSTFTATQGYLGAVGGGTKKDSAGTVVSSAQTPAQGSEGSALASHGTVASSALTAQRNTSQDVRVVAGCALATIVAVSAFIASGRFAEASFTKKILLLAMTVLTIRLAFVTYKVRAAASTAGNTTLSARAATTSSVVAAKDYNTEKVAAGNDLGSVSTMSGSAISVVKGTPAYIAVTKHQPSAGYASTSAFLQSEAAKGISASTRIILLVPELCPLGDLGAVAGAIVNLKAAGIGFGGIEPTSSAAAVHSNILTIDKGSIFALLQSEGMRGEEVAVIL